MSNEQDLRYIRTNQLLVSAFTELLSRKKFEDITVNELCEKALVRRATFYTHFLDKYDFFSYFIRQHRDRFAETLPTAKGSIAPDEFFLHMSRQLIRYIGEHMTLVQNALDSSAFPILLSIFSEQIRKDLLDELSACGADPSGTGALPELLAAFYSGGLIQIVHTWIKDEDRISESALAEQIRLLVTAHPVFSHTDIAAAEQHL